MASKKIGFDPAKATVPVETNEGTDAVLERTRSKPLAEQRKQIGVKIPMELYNEFERLKAIRKPAGETLTFTDLIVDCIAEYMNEHRHEIEEYDRKMAQEGKP